MSPGTIARLRRRGSDDRGFGFLEIIVSIGIFGIAVAALFPLLVSSIRAANLAKLHTQAKNLLQERVEMMRNLPFHVANSAGPYVDLLDIYFRDLASPSSNARCDSAKYDAATLTYTCTLTTKLNFKGFSETVATRFVDQNRNVVAPLASYNSQSASNGDIPPANTVSSDITVTYKDHGITKSFHSSTQIGSASGGLPQIVSRVRDSAVAIDSTSDDNAIPTIIRFNAGTVNADGSLSTGATAHATASGALASLSSGETTTGQAQGTLDAPPDQPTFSTVNGVSAGGIPCTSFWACFGPTSVANVTGTASNGLPNVGSTTYPASAVVTKSGSATDRGLWFSNVPTGAVQSRLTRLKVQDSANPPTVANPTELVQMVQGSNNNGYDVTCGGATAISNADFVKSTGYIKSTGGTSHTVTACATATTREIDIMPTSFAPSGVVQVFLDYASLTCATAGTSASVTPRYSARVRYWSADTGGYVQVAVSDAQTSDPLTATLLNKSTGGVVVWRDPSNPTDSDRWLWLGDYLKSWSSGAFNGGPQSGNVGAQGDLDVVALTTRRTRDADAVGASSINVNVGSLSCLAEDNR